MSLVDQEYLSEYDQKLNDQSRQVESDIDASGLSQMDMVYGTSDRFSTARRMTNMEQYVSSENEVNRKAKDSMMALAPKIGLSEEDITMAFVTDPEIGYKDIKADRDYMALLKKYDEQIVKVREEDPLYYPDNNPLKTTKEIEQEFVNDYAKVVATDDQETEHSTFLGQLSFAAGAIVGYMEDPGNLVSIGATAPVVASKYGAQVLAAQGIKQTMAAGARFAGMEAVVDTTRDAVINRPHYYDLRKEALGEDASFSQIATDLTIQAGATAALSFVGIMAGDALAKRFKWGSSVQEEQPGAIPESGPRYEPPDEMGNGGGITQDSGVVTREFVNKFEEAKPYMDPVEADVVQEVVDLAKTTPEHLSQSQHGRNYQVALEQVMKGEDVNVPFRALDEPSTSSVVPETAIEQPRIQETPPKPDELIMQTYNEIKSKLDTMDDLETLPDTFREQNVASEITVGSLKQRLKEHFDDVDALDKIITCWSKGGPSGGK